MSKKPTKANKAKAKIKKAKNKDGATVKKVKKKNGEEKVTARITAEVKLTQEDIAEIGINIVEIQDMLNNLEEKKKKDNANLNTKIKELKLRRNEIVEAHIKGRISKTVDAEKRINMSTKTVEYWFNDEIIKTGPLTTGDVQKDLDLGDDDILTEIDSALKLKPGEKILYKNAMDIETDQVIKEVVLQKNGKPQIFIEGFSSFLRRGSIKPRTEAK